MDEKDRVIGRKINRSTPVEKISKISSSFACLFLSSKKGSKFHFLTKVPCLFLTKVFVNLFTLFFLM